jgi:hypothetical protein
VDVGLFLKEHDELGIFISLGGKSAAVAVFALGLTCWSAHRISPLKKPLLL